MRKLFLAVIAAAVTTGAAIAMSPQPKAQSADSIQAQQTAQMVKEAAMQTGMPGITNFTEKKAVKWLYELRDEPNYRTHTYIVTISGEFIKVCDSVGYGINASIQYSNPERRDWEDPVGSDTSPTYLPQPEPNGLFMPEGLAATYVMCVDADNDDVKAVYVEPEVVVSPFPLSP